MWSRPTPSYTQDTGEGDWDLVRLGRVPLGSSTRRGTPELTRLTVTGPGREDRYTGVVQVQTALETQSRSIYLVPTIVGTQGTLRNLSGLEPGDT